MSVSADRPPRLHVIAAARELDDPETWPALLELLRAPAPLALHLRARVSDARLVDAATDLARAARDAGSWCVVNGRPDIALAASAQAVQLGRAALSVADARRVLPADSGVRIGASVHDAAGASAAIEEGAHHLVAGTVYATPTHPGRAGSGPSGIERVRAAVGSRVPIFAIGGVDRERVREVLAAGADGIVVYRAVWSAPRPVEAAGDLLEELAAAAGRSE